MFFDNGRNIHVTRRSNNGPDTFLANTVSGTGGNFSGTGLTGGRVTTKKIVRLGTGSTASRAILEEELGKLAAANILALLVGERNAGGLRCATETASVQTLGARFNTRVTERFSARVAELGAIVDNATLICIIRNKSPVSRAKVSAIISPKSPKLRERIRLTCRSGSGIHHHRKLVRP